MPSDSGRSIANPQLFLHSHRPYTPLKRTSYLHYSQHHPACLCCALSAALDDLRSKGWAHLMPRQQCALLIPSTPAHAQQHLIPQPAAPHLVQFVIQVAKHRRRGHRLATQYVCRTPPRAVHCFVLCRIHPQSTHCRHRNDTSRVCRGRYYKLAAGNGTVCVCALISAQPVAPA